MWRKTSFLLARYQNNENNESPVDEPVTATVAIRLHDGLIMGVWWHLEPFMIILRDIFPSATGQGGKLLVLDQIA